MKNSPFEAAAPRFVPSIVRIALERIGRLVCAGTLVIDMPDGEVLRYTGSDAPGPDAQLRLHNLKPLWALATCGSIGFAESYLAGDWDTDSLPGLLYFAACNEDADRGVTTGLGILSRLTAKVQHHLHANSRRQARRNIAYHYDLGNAFYAHWLDPSMTYSAGIFKHPDEPLADAQARKYARLADMAGITPGDRVIEIGCGWGGFMEYVAKRGADVTGVSISREQCRYTDDRLARAGLADVARVKFSDYRDLDGCFDRIVSIEMFEAVGEAFWDTYAARLRALLRPGGVAALQVITIDESRFDGYRTTPDFIQKYIFPGGMLPSKTVLEETFGRAGLSVTDRTAFGPDYAQTIRHWRDGFDRAWSEIRKLGFDDRFRRLWHFYLAYCEAGFRSGATDVVQIRLEHTG
jgi:cyclopropane-fatty-acyl-phospholipid synthase